MADKINRAIVNANSFSDSNTVFRLLTSYVAISMA